MQAYVLETLHVRCWRRGGEVYWSLAEAKDAARWLLKKRACRAARVLAMELDFAAVAELPEKAEGGENE